MADLNSVYRLGMVNAEQYAKAVKLLREDFFDTSVVRERARSEAKWITEAVRTPAEAFRDEIATLKELFISVNIAGKPYEESLQRLKEFACMYLDCGDDEEKEEEEEEADQPCVAKPAPPLLGPR